MKLVCAYLGRLHEIRSTHRQTPELSYRGALENLLNTIGNELDPPVQATGELADTGDGRPDFGFFEIKSGNSRGAVEVKPPEEDVPLTADGLQVSRYVKKHGCVLVTNYRDFLLVVSNGNGKATVEGRCTLSRNTEEFWRCKSDALAKDKAEELVDFLIGVMKRSAPITRPSDLADDLARHAREAKRRLERHDISALAPLKEAMEKALGLHFAGKEGEDFFRSSLVQTLFYGLFSGWMLWREGKHKVGTFDWKDASEYLPLPLIGNLYEEIARPKKLADLGLREPLDWSTASLGRVEEAAFFKDFDQDHAITLFYEPFLQAFDPELRKQLGVWYTPPEIVQYMVGRVDQLLRSELGIENGLADEKVYVLDPCCGTGSYLLEVARRIHQTLLDQGHGSLAAGEVKKALTTRVLGFEILPAPYVVSHLQLGVLLRQIKTSFGPKQRAGVYLTNALTGWEPPKGAKQTLAFSFLEEEQEAATKVKRDAPILVILGNPPYNGYAGVALEEEADLIAPYKDGLYDRWHVSKQLLDDLYIRFFRLAETRIGEHLGRGIVCYISNYSWLDGLSHPVMREHVLKHFDQIWIDNCNGDKYRTGKRTPDGKPDQSMFTTDSQAVGIQVGTAIATFIRHSQDENANPDATVHYRDLWGYANDKRKELLSSLSDPRAAEQYTILVPTFQGRFALGAGGNHEGYFAWPPIAELFRTAHSGVKSNCDELTTDISRDALVARMRDYCDADLPFDELKDRYPKAGDSRGDYDARTGRQTNTRIGFQQANVLPILYRPFDYRWIYNEHTTKLINSPRPEFVADARIGHQLFLECRQKIPTPAFDRGLVCATIGETLGNGTASFYPLFVQEEQLLGTVVDPNFRDAVLQTLCAQFGEPLLTADGSHHSAQASRVAATLFYHLLAILWSPAYRKDNEAALRQDWPRVPIPADAAILDASAKLGRTVADLLLPDKPVPGVTTGTLRDEVKALAVPTKVGGSPIEEPADTKVEAGWGFRGQKNAVMCGKGKITENKDNPDALNIWINDRVYWSNVPADVWAMTIGGYPVVKKWLSYREYKVLGRALKTEELTYIAEVVRRLKALLLLGDDLDANYRKAAQAKQLKTGTDAS